MSKELSETIQELGEAFEDFKKANDARVDALEKSGEENSEARVKLDNVEVKLDELEEMKSRLEKAEIKLDAPEFTTGDDAKRKAEEKQLLAFEDMIRGVKFGEKSFDPERQAAYVEASKAVTIGSDTAGGHAVPEVISRMIEQKLLDISELLPVVKTVNVGTSQYQELVDENEAGYGWVGEGDTRSETTTSSLQQVVPTMGIVYAYPKASEESLQDIFFDVQSWLIDTASQGFDKGIGAAIISGDGSNKPTGFLGTPVAIDDDGASPERAFGTIQYVPTGTAGALPPAFNLNSSPQVTAVQGDFLYDIIYKLKKGYRRNARWLMNKATLGSVRKFRDADGQYLWTPGLTVGQNNILAGFPVLEAEDMQDVGANTFPIAFGDFSSYTFVNRVGMSLTIDDNITTPGQVKFYLRKRVGGKLRNDDAIKVAKCAAS
jgi:HK97 family phage major capsid protein